VTTELHPSASAHPKFLALRHAPGVVAYLDCSSLVRSARSGAEGSALNTHARLVRPRSRLPLMMSWSSGPQLPKTAKRCKKTVADVIRHLVIFATPLETYRRPEAYFMMSRTTFDHFQALEVEVEETSIFLRRFGSGPAVLLLHGFPQTHLMWRSMAPSLARRFTVICADLRGYGRSGCPTSRSDHAPYTKRAMAKDMVSVMEKLGFPRFSVGGHDRGGRVAYRLALDHPERVERLAVLDVLPIADAWERADKKLAISYWPWSLLAQPEPLPERLVSGAPDAVVDNALGGWGSPANTFSQEVREAYIDVLRDPARVHAICEEYRAAATLDHEHDAEDRRAGRQIACPILVLWSGRGPLNSWYAAEGGPLALWRSWANDVRGGPLDAGHFFPEELPQRTAEELSAFFAA
jgi:haloacetate dehalogenase